VRQPQRLGQLAVRPRGPQQRRGVGQLEPRALDPHALARLHRPGSLDQRPLPRPAAHAPEQRRLDRRHPRRLAGDHQHRQPERRVQCMNVDHVEPRDRDPLQQHRLHVPRERRALQQPRDPPRRVDSVAADLADDHAVEPRLRAHRPDQRDVPAVLADEWRVVEADHVGEPAHAHRTVAAPGPPQFPV
jgi:hypothetical protein